MKKIAVLLVLFLAFGCTEETISSPQYTTLLKSINDFEFNDNGLPKGKVDLSNNSIQFFYKNETTLDSIKIGLVAAFGSDTREFSIDYNSYNLLDKVLELFMDDHQIINTISQYTYQGNTVDVLYTQEAPSFVTNHRFTSEQSYTFKSNDYTNIQNVHTKIIQTVISTGSMFETNINQTFQYDENDNLTQLSQEVSGPITGSMTRVISFEYDDQENPFLYLQQYSPFNFTFQIPGLLDIPSDGFPIEWGSTMNSVSNNVFWMLRNSPNNVTRYVVSNGSSTTETVYENVYEYNDEGYPVSKEVFINGVSSYTYSFTYH